MMGVSVIFLFTRSPKGRVWGYVTLPVLDHTTSVLHLVFPPIDVYARISTTIDSVPGPVSFCFADTKTHEVVHRVGLEDRWSHIDYLSE